MSLVADYDSSSSDEASEEKNKTNSVPLAPAVEMLNSNSSISCSIFSNPYREAENSGYAILEKHVKMTEVVLPKIKEEKKVCWKFYKGKCKHGDKCHFYHQSPVPMNSNLPQDSELVTDPIGNEEVKKMKKRSGLKDDLVPPKKFMKIYKKTK